MKLLDWLKNNSDEFIYVGSQSAFFFIGPAEELLSTYKVISERLYEEGVRTYERNCSELKRVQNNLRDIPAVIENLQAELTDFRGSDELKEIKQEELDKDIKILENAKFRIQTLPELCEKGKNYIENFTDVSEREIIDCYDRVDVPPLGKIVKIEGSELGRYWFYSEYTGVSMTDEDIDEV